MNEFDETRLNDMLDQTRLVAQFIKGFTRDDLDTNTMLAYAVVRGIEVIGEAASHGSQETRQILTQVEWKNIVGM